MAISKDLSILDKKLPMQKNVPDSTRRIRIIDIVKGAAVLGIFTMNVSDMAYPGDLVLDFDATDPERGWNYWTGIVLETLFYGKMRGLFTLLFGVSSILIIEKLDWKADGLAAAEVYFRRLLWLLVFGFINAYVFLWWGDVLYQYALLGMLLFAFARASYGVLTAAALTCLAILSIQPVFEYNSMEKLQRDYNIVHHKQQSSQSLISDDQEILGRWQERLSDMQPDYESIEEELQTKTAHYLAVFSYNARQVLEEQTTRFYQEDAWDMLLYMFVGIILFRLGFFNESVRQSVHLTVALIGIGIGLTIHAWMNIGLQNSSMDPVISSWYPIFFDPGRLPFVIGYLSLIIFVFRMKIFACVGNGIAAAGKMALSNYLMQSVIGAFVFYGFGLAKFNQLDRLEIVGLIVFVWIFHIIFSLMWLRLFYYGPFEWIWRSLTYWKAQPLRRT